MLFDQNMIIDATRGSIARFVNHSCQPNCRMEKWTVGGKPRMALYAGDQGIMTGDELTYDYNFDPFSQKNVQECRCGSGKCRGVLGPKPKDERKAKGEKDSAHSAANAVTGAKRKIAELLDEGGDRWNKRPKIALPRSAVAAIKKVAPTGARPARAGVYSSARSSPVKAATRAALVKKPNLRGTSLSSRTAITRSPSMLKQAVNGAIDKATTRRIVSKSSATEALLQDRSERPLSRKASMKTKAESIRKSVVRIVRRGSE